RAVAGRTNLRRSDCSGAMACFARIKPSDLQFLYAAADRVPKINFELILKRAAFFGFLFDCAATTAAAKKLAEQIAETRSACAALASAAKIEAAEVEINVAPGAARAVVARRHVLAVKAVLIVHLALLRVRENVVGFLQLLEFFFGGFVAGIQIGMVFAREFAECRTNILGGRFARHAKEFVIIGFCCCGHLLSKIATLKRKSLRHDVGQPELQFRPVLKPFRWQQKPFSAWNCKPPELWFGFGGQARGLGPSS